MWWLILIILIIGWRCLNPEHFDGLWFWNPEGQIVQFPYHEPIYHHVTTSQDRQHMFKSSVRLIPPVPANLQTVRASHQWDHDPPKHHGTS